MTDRDRSFSPEDQEIIDKLISTFQDFMLLTADERGVAYGLVRSYLTTMPELIKQAITLDASGYAVVKYDADLFADHLKMKRHARQVPDHLPDDWT